MKVVIIDKISIVWSWKKISCSIMGDEAFWRVIFLHTGIFNEGAPIYRF